MILGFVNSNCELGVRVKGGEKVRVYFFYFCLICFDRFDRVWVNMDPGTGVWTG